jgi:putative hydrolase of HD superfamily
MDSRVLYELFRNAGKLKTLKRSGWVDHGIEAPESVADHSFRVAFMAMILGDLLGLDAGRLLRMSLLHDFGEVLAGDITPAMGLPAAEKRAAERQALHELLAGCENGQAYIDLWEEYERGEVPEARLLKNIDKLEMALQAVEYACCHPHQDFTPFLSNVAAALDLQPVRDLLEIALAAHRRPAPPRLGAQADEAAP